jgi:predicted SAM-dependent methyltransferase
MIDIGGAKGYERPGDDRWKIVDIAKSADYVLNLNDGKLPFENGEVMFIYCSHTLEHIEPASIPLILKEFRRVLNKKKGIIRFVVPDCEIAIKWYIKNSPQLRSKGGPSRPKVIPPTRMGFLTSWFYTPNKGAKGGHRIGFDYELLHTYLKNAGFSKIVRKKYGVCSDIFVGKDYPRYQPNSMYVEVSK